MQFTSLRLSGFKSFVDSTELAIEPGLTGIVGPNGCGKSNLVEALRWVMGEGSAKRMRGSEMDDVIFAGTANRPARNFAEVALTLDNRRRSAPSQFNHADDLDVVRRIDRGDGSGYKVNGKTVRARDVQLLFADNASGANSPALVSQGRVSALISAKPADRRMILEEAAGISGLHQRRHEAELRLKGAEQNLTRLDDVLQTFETQLNSVRKQVRQATRYRTLSEHIRRAEATILHLRWTAATAELAEAREAFAEADQAVSEALVAVRRDTQAQAEAAEALGPLRKSETEAAARLQRLTGERDQLAAEERRVGNALNQAQRSLDQVTKDTEREGSLASDAEAALTRLDEEAARLRADGESAPELLAGVRAAVEAASAELTRLESALAEATEAVAEAQATRNSLNQRRSALARNHQQWQDKRLKATADRDSAVSQKAALPDPEEAAQAVDAAERRLAEAEAAAERAETVRAEADRAASEAVEQSRAAEAEVSRLGSEADGVRAMLAGGDDSYPPVIDQLAVDDGYETAIAAAFRNDLDAALDPQAPVFWASPPDPSGDGMAVPPLPEGAEPLCGYVRGPDELSRALAAIGVVRTDGDGDRLAQCLAPGQCLVSRDGAAWRWDGLRLKAGAPTAAAIKLQQMNRLRTLDERLAEAHTVAESRRQAHEGARTDVASATQADREAREARKHASRALEQARTAHGKALRQQEEMASRLTTLEQTLAEAKEREADAEADLSAIDEEIAALPDTEGLAANRARLKDQVAEARAARDRESAEVSRLEQAEAERARRLEAIDHERADWRRRHAGTDERLAELSERRREAERTLERLSSRPAEIAAKREALADTISEADRARQKAADDLAAAETRAREADQALKSAEQALADGRERRAHAEARVGAANDRLGDVRQAITEKLDCPPEALQSAAGLSDDEPAPERDAVEARLAKLIRERDGMGPVNLRAEEEAREVEEQIAAMTRERDDLIAAIDRLRQGINRLNREARERLVAAFERVDSHFQDLFIRLFGGGTAQLQLTDADDPLQAGLEILASPPGKKLQSLSLLSGGEQALTALAAIFAVFQTNPAPICVLDEVDAPLDEANVDRFCALLEDLAQSTATRFLLVTHHRMTMARMHRLYGVTMSERGISQLVSVDLQRAEAVRATA